MEYYVLPAGLSLSATPSTAEEEEEEADAGVTGSSRNLDSCAPNIAFSAAPIVGAHVALAQSRSTPSSSLRSSAAVSCLHPLQDRELNSDRV